MTYLDKTSHKQKDLRRRMRKLKIFEKDIREAFVRSPKSGGQNVNKVSTCVQLTHVPSGIQVKCYEERTQALNRYKARHTLVKKIEDKLHAQKLREVQEYEKKKRANRKRPQYLKEAILETKHKQSEKKKSRRKIKPDTAD